MPCRSCKYCWSSCRKVVAVALGSIYASCFYLTYHIRPPHHFPCQWDRIHSNSHKKMFIKLCSNYNLSVVRLKSRANHRVHVPKLCNDLSGGHFGGWTNRPSWGGSRAHDHSVGSVPHTRPPTKCIEIVNVLMWTANINWVSFLNVIDLSSPSNSFKGMGSSPGEPTFWALLLSFPQFLGVFVEFWKANFHFVYAYAGGLDG